MRRLLDESRQQNPVGEIWERTTRLYLPLERTRIFLHERLARIWSHGNKTNQFAVRIWMEALIFGPLLAEGLQASTRQNLSASLMRARCLSDFVFAERK